MAFVVISQDAADYLTHLVGRKVGKKNDTSFRWRSYFVLEVVDGISDHICAFKYVMSV